jgi:hypothetical protein
MLETLDFIGDPGWIRTNGPQLRRLVLYPAELRGLAWRKVYPRRVPIESEPIERRCAIEQAPPMVRPPGRG